MTRFIFRQRRKTGVTGHFVSSNPLSINHVFIAFLILILANVSDTCGCWSKRSLYERRPSEDDDVTVSINIAKPPGSITMSPDSISTSISSIFIHPGSISTASNSITTPSHRQPCSPWDEERAACVNGGICYVIDISDDIRTAPLCSCTEDWMGERCEKRFIDPKYYPGIIPEKECRDVILMCAGIILLCLIVVGGVVLLIICFCKRRRRRKGRSYGQHSANNGKVYVETPPENEWIAERNKSVHYDLIEINGNYSCKSHTADEKDGRDSSTYKIPLARLASEEL